MARVRRPSFLLILTFPKAFKRAPAARTREDMPFTQKWAPRENSPLEPYFGDDTATDMTTMTWAHYTMTHAHTPHDEDVGLSTPKPLPRRRTQAPVQ